MSETKPPKIIIAGAPASGKGTQCEMLVEKFGVVHISTGDALRAEVEKGSELGAKAKECMDAGALVPDDLIIGIVKERLAQEDCQKNGWLLDGFPRTGAQAEALAEAEIVPTHFVLLDVPDDILVERCEGRRSDPETGKIYHIKFNPPPEDPEVQARLIHRSDDTAEAMGKRITMYHENVSSIIGNYKHICQAIKGTNDKMEIAAEIANFIENGRVPPKVIIAGAPASGKGTQCELIVERFGVVHISTGDALRAEVEKGSELGAKAKECMDAGALVPDDLIINIVKERLAQEDCQKNGWLLDGFPRTGAQAEALATEGVVATHFVLLDVPDDILVERCEGRRSDPETGKIYHLKFNPPPEDEEIQARLVHRSDDTAEAMGKRITMYHENVSSIIGNYEHISKKFDGTRDKAEIAKEVAQFLMHPVEAKAEEVVREKTPPPPEPETMKIIIAGAPASGKGTQCELIVEKYGVVHISTGDALRAEVLKGSELGAKAKECMDAGALVPDDLIINIVKERLAQEDCQKNGWLLDGFPRTGVQADELKSSGIVPTHFVLLDVPEGILVERCEGRRSDPETGKIYHLKFNPPPKEVVPRLVHRSDDTAEAMGKRIAMYKDNVNSVVGNYEGIMRRFNGSKDKSAIFADVAAFLDGAPRPEAPKTRKVMICGAPASGKGTQCDGIVSDFGLVHISTGDELRMHVRQGTPLGVLAKKYMDDGALVPDSLMVEIVKERLGHMDVYEKGWLLDGFPRTGAQVSALRQEGVEPDAVVLLDVPDDILVERCEGRRLDPSTGAIYHLLYNPPPPEVIDRLVHRSDDTAEAMVKRIAMYHSNIAAILTFYLSKCRKINGVRKPSEIRDEVRRFIAGELPPSMSGIPPRKPIPSPEEAMAYVEKNMMPFIVKGCAALCKTKPDKPLKFLAEWMIDNNPNKPLVDNTTDQIKIKEDVNSERH